MEGRNVETGGGQSRVKGPDLQTQSQGVKDEEKHQEEKDGKDAERKKTLQTKCPMLPDKTQPGDRHLNEDMIGD